HQVAPRIASISAFGLPGASCGGARFDSGWPCRRAKTVVAHAFRAALLSIIDKRRAILHTGFTGELPRKADWLPERSWPLNGHGKTRRIGRLPASLHRRPGSPLEAARCGGTFGFG